MLLSSLSLSPQLQSSLQAPKLPFHSHTPFMILQLFPIPDLSFSCSQKKKKKKKQKELEECIDLGIPTLLDDEAVRP
jgi:hypothetical protein